ncbi:hypothetical protein JSE7799_02825 [Jannaschia seosinensis]|uniref:Uncharacterized protein n=1 Tax=Jannaschia seosinensis TaxID=313367 RepID=A0A0M7BFK1_9RHOB|nr:hypothetical protein JSE7799_02825 [Jannaschia seosinensis]
MLDTEGHMIEDPSGQPKIDRKRWLRPTLSGIGMIARSTHLKMGSAFRNVCYEFVSQIAGCGGPCVRASTVAG